MDIFTSLKYGVIEERRYIRTNLLEKWFRLQGSIIQIEIGDGIKGERIPNDYANNPVEGDLYGITYKVVPLEWLVRSYHKKRNQQFVSFLEQLDIG